MSAVPPILIIVIIIAIAALATVAYQHDQKRKRLLKAWAHSKGLVVHDRTQRGWEKEYPAFKIFNRGHSRRTSLHIEGEVDGRRLRALDYRFTTGSGKNQQRHRRSMVFLDTDTPVIPLHIRPEHIFDKVGEFFGHEDIDFESYEFSKRFHVSSSDRKWAYDVIHQGTMDYLLEAPSVHIEFGFNEIAVYKSGALTGERCQECLKVARRMLDLIPDNILTQPRGDSN